MNPDSPTNGKPNEPKPTAKFSGERVIQPLDPNLRSNNTASNISAAPKPAMHDASSIYPDAVKTINSSTPQDANQAFALEMTRTTANEVNTPVSLRVKTVLLVGILLAIGTIADLIAIMGQMNGPASGPAGLMAVEAVVMVIELLMAVTLLISNDKHRVGLVLKIALVFQLVSLFMSLGRLAAGALVGFILNIVIVAVLFYAIARVSSLRMS